MYILHLNNTHFPPFPLNNITEKGCIVFHSSVFNLQSFYSKFWVG